MASLSHRLRNSAHAAALWNQRLFVRSMAGMIRANLFRRGNWVEIEGAVSLVRKTAVTRSGKGGGFAVLTLKDIRSGAITTKRFRSEENLLQVTMEKARATLVLYREGDAFVCCDDITFDQFSLPMSEFGENGDGAKFVVEGETKVSVVFHEEEPISVELPRSVELEVKSTPPKSKTDNDKKIATCAVGSGSETIEIRVPQYVEDGDRIGVSPETTEFLERV